MPRRFTHLLALLTACAWNGAELTKATVEAFDGNIATVERGLEPRFRGDGFLGQQNSANWRQQLQRGTTLVQSVAGNGIVTISGGLIQDWSGAIFIPHSSLKQTIAVVQDYARHKVFYHPTIADAKVRIRANPANMS